MCLRAGRDYRNSVTLSLSPDTTSCFVVDHDLTIPRMGSYLHQNLGGFMCYICLKKPRIFNPATRQLVTLPAAIKPIPAPPDEAALKEVQYYFGHDPLTDQYKVVCSTGVYLNNPLPVGIRPIRSEHRVFVLKPRGGGGSWKKLAPPTPPSFLPHIPSHGGVSIDGVIYYLGWINTRRSMLVSFHIRSQDFKMIQLPLREENVNRVEKVSLIEYGGKATIVDQTNLKNKGMLDLWDVDEKKKWSKKTLVLKPSQLHLVNNTEFSLKGTTQDGKVFLIPKVLVSPFHILSYDLRSNDLRKIDIKGVPEHWFSKDKSTVRVMLAEQSESLVSLET
ncbi:unnamed protein product [Microthlaspi erraticum]|uniref:F-box associated beta-propeller type 3 domain-containing protein n=1 Tax=Microthlaspi erraticum TaxID=1685480 RepID=A0A6D2HLH3_9BRAS|nr:unnamed protein product [Microthlaspi erraticum]CAA7018107.1 unnamed protein product [Microthlaspi erraticum]